MRSFIDHAYQNKESTCGDTVVDHLQYSPFNTLSIKNKYTQGDKSHMPHTGVGDKFLHIGLGQGCKTAVDNTCYGKPEDIRHECDSSLRCYGQAETQETVGSHLKQNTCQYH